MKTMGALRDECFKMTEDLERRFLVTAVESRKKCMLKWSIFLDALVCIMFLDGVI